MIKKTLISAFLSLSMVFTGVASAAVTFQQSQKSNEDQIVIIGQLPDNVKEYIPVFFADNGLEREIVFSDQIQVNIESNLKLPENNEIAPTQLFNSKFEANDNQVIILGNIPRKIQDTIKVLVASNGYDVELVFANSVRGAATLETVRDSGPGLFTKSATQTLCFGYYIAEGTARLSGDKEGDRIASTVTAINNWRAKAPLQARRGGFRGEINLNPEFDLISCTSSERLKTMTCKVRADVCAIIADNAACN